MGRISRTAAAAGVALFMLLGTTTGSHAHTYHALRLSNTLLAPSTKGAYWGAYLPPNQWTPQGQMNAVTSVESALGRKMDIINMYYPWDTAFPTWRETWDLQNGRIPMISWNGTDTDAILSGQYDSMIAQRADAVKALGGNVFIRFYWEMDGKKKASWVHTPAKFVAAWRHVHDIFVAQGVTNVAWVWCPDAWAFNAHTAMQYYPGDNYVDWIGADGYNWGGRNWGSFKSKFQAFYNSGAGRKPLMVGETGTVAKGGSKSKWIRHMGHALQYHFPSIRAVCWFNSVDGSFDWRVTNSPKWFKAWKSVGDNPYFNISH